VASKGSVSEVVVRSQKARVDTGVDVVHLEAVRVIVSSGKAADSDEPGEAKRHLEITCDRGELNLTTSDFSAEGNVEGKTDSGIDFKTDRVRYDHEDGVLLTDAPVLITDSSGTFRGGGFRYVVEERRFRLLGGASVVQEN
jgi:LPS export ABC transporter protein LptC